MSTLSSPPFPSETGMSAQPFLRPVPQENTAEKCAGRTERNNAHNRIGGQSVMVDQKAAQQERQKKQKRARQSA